MASPHPMQSLKIFFTGAFSSSYAAGNMLAQASLLLLTGMGTIIAFRSGSFNLGGEGQVYASAAASVSVALALGNTSLPPLAGIVLIISAGTLCGAVLAAISGLSRLKWQADELITSFMIGAAAIPLVNYFFQHTIPDPGSSLLRTPFIASNLQLSRILPPSLLSLGALVALAVWAVGCIFIDHGIYGSRLKLAGSCPDFADSEGLPTKKIRANGFIISGALHGFAGSLLVAGMYHAGIVGFSQGLGWNGIAVALIAGNHPKRLLPAAILFSCIVTGAKQASILSNLHLDAGILLQAIVFLVITIQITRTRRQA